MLHTPIKDASPIVKNIELLLVNMFETIKPTASDSINTSRQKEVQLMVLNTLLKELDRINKDPKITIEEDILFRLEAFLKDNVTPSRNRLPFEFALKTYRHAIFTEIIAIDEESRRGRIQAREKSAKGIIEDAVDQLEKSYGSENETIIPVIRKINDRANLSSKDIDSLMMEEPDFLKKLQLSAIKSAMIAAKRRALPAVKLSRNEHFFSMVRIAVSMSLNRNLTSYDSVNEGNRQTARKMAERVIDFYQKKGDPEGLWNAITNSGAVHADPKWEVNDLLDRVPKNPVLVKLIEQIRKEKKVEAAAGAPAVSVAAPAASAPTVTAPAMGVAAGAPAAPASLTAPAPAAAPAPASAAAPAPAPALAPAISIPGSLSAPKVEPIAPRSLSEEEIPPPIKLPTADELIAKIGNFEVEFDKEHIGDGTTQVSALLGKEGSKILYDGVEERPSTSAREKFIRALVAALNDPKKQNKSKERDPLKRTTDINDLLGPEGVKLYMAAKKEEAASRAYRNAVFLKSTTKHGKDKWAKPMVLWVGGPSASGKSYGSNAVIAKMDAEVMEKAPDGAGKGNYVVSIDGGIERETSQIRNLLLQVALTQGYSGVGNLGKFDKKDKLKGKIQKAALKAGDLSLVIPATFTSPIGPLTAMRKFNKMHKKGEIVHAFSMVTPEKSLVPLQQEENDKRMKRTVKRMGIARALRTAPYTGGIDPNNGKLAGCESKIYEDNYESGKDASELAKAFFELNNPDPICFDIESDLMFVKKDEKGNWVECPENDEDLNVKMLTRRDHLAWEEYNRATPPSKDKMSFEIWLSRLDKSPIKISKPETRVSFLITKEGYEVILRVTFKSKEQLRKALKKPPFDHIVFKLENGQALTPMESRVIVKLNLELNRLHGRGDKTLYITANEANQRIIQNLTNLHQSEAYRILLEVMKSQPKNKQAIARLEVLNGQAQSLDKVRSTAEWENSLSVSKGIQKTMQGSMQVEKAFQDLGNVFFGLTDAQKKKYSISLGELRDVHVDTPFATKKDMIAFLQEKAEELSPAEAEPYQLMLRQLETPSPAKEIARSDLPIDEDGEPELPPPPNDVAPLLPIEAGPDLAPSLRPEEPADKPGYGSFARTMVARAGEVEAEVARLSVASSLPEEDEELEEEELEEEELEEEELEEGAELEDAESENDEELDAVEIESRNPLEFRGRHRGKGASLNISQSKAYRENFSEGIFETLAEVIKKRSDVNVSDMAGLRQTVHFGHQLDDIIPFVEFALRGATVDPDNSDDAVPLKKIKDLFESLAALAKSSCRFSEDYYHLKMQEIRSLLEDAGTAEEDIKKLIEAIDEVVKPQLFKGRRAYNTAGTGSTEFDPNKDINLAGYKKRVKIESKDNGASVKVQFSYNPNTLLGAGAKGKLWAAFHQEGPDFQQQMAEFVTVAINEYNKGSDKNPLKISYSNPNNPKPEAALGILMEFKKRAITEGRDFFAVDHNGNTITLSSDHRLSKAEKEYFLHFAQKKAVVKGLLGGLDFSPPAGYGVFYKAFKDMPNIDKNNISTENMEKAMQQSLNNMVTAHKKEQVKAMDIVINELERTPISRERSSFSASR